MGALKIVVLGGQYPKINMTDGACLTVYTDGGVGKSGLAVRFIKGDYFENYDPTIEGMVPILWTAHDTALMG